MLSSDAGQQSATRAAGKLARLSIIPVLSGWAKTGVPAGKRRRYYLPIPRGTAAFADARDCLAACPDSPERSVNGTHHAKPSEQARCAFSVLIAQL